MPRIKMTIEYDGGNYHGFQSQQNAVTIQDEIERQILRLTGESVRILSAGRTDAGVHARGQVIAFDTESTIPGQRWADALNTFMPEDIKILDSCQVNSMFQPQFEALRKKYGYYLYHQKNGACFYRRYALCITEKLDFRQMEQAARNFEGTHSFRGFCAAGSSVKTYRRTVFECVGNQAGPVWSLTIEANGFLYNMVRIIMGTLLEVGRHKLDPDDIIPIIKSQDRTRAGPTVPPQGLHLLNVTYPTELE